MPVLRSGGATATEDGNALEVGNPPPPVAGLRRVPACQRLSARLSSPAGEANGGQAVAGGQVARRKLGGATPQMRGGAPQKQQIGVIILGIAKEGTK